MDKEKMELFKNGSVIKVKQKMEIRFQGEEYYLMSHQRADFVNNIYIPMNNITHNRKFLSRSSAIQIMELLDERFDADQKNLNSLLKKVFGKYVIISSEFFPSNERLGESYKFKAKKLSSGQKYDPNGMEIEFYLHEDNDVNSHVEIVGQLQLTYV